MPKTVKGVNTVAVSVLRLPNCGRGRRRGWTAKTRRNDPSADDSSYGGVSGLQQEAATAAASRQCTTSLSGLCKFNLNTSTLLIGFMHCSAFEQLLPHPDSEAKLWLLRPPK